MHAGPIGFDILALGGFHELVHFRGVQTNKQPDSRAICQYPVSLIIIGNFGEGRGRMPNEQNAICILDWIQFWWCSFKNAFSGFLWLSFGLATLTILGSTNGMIKRVCSWIRERGATNQPFVANQRANKTNKKQ